MYSDPAILARSLRPMSLRGNGDNKPRPAQDLVFASRSRVFSPSEDISAHEAFLESNERATIDNAESKVLVAESKRMDALLCNQDWQNHAVTVAVQNDGDPFLANNGKSFTGLSAVLDLTVSVDEAGKQLALIDQEPSTPYQPRGDREIGEISGDNAQAIFSPNACVFVAK